MSNDNKANKSYSKLFSKLLEQEGVDNQKIDELTKVLTSHEMITLKMAMIGITESLKTLVDATKLEVIIARGSINTEVVRIYLDTIAKYSSTMDKLLTDYDAKLAEKGLQESDPFQQKDQDMDIMKDFYKKSGNN